MTRKTSTIQLPSIEKAVETYYSKTELNTSDIRALFGCGACKALNIKKEVQARMAKENVHCWTPGAVSTRIAYEVWGIDIEDYEKRLTKLRKLGLIPNRKEETA